MNRLVCALIASSLAVNSGTIIAGELGEIALVSQLSDISPNDWEFLALKSLVDRYGCLPGFPANSQSLLARDRFATLLHNCLPKIPASQLEGDRNTIAAIERLRADFPDKLKRIEALDSRIATLEERQFSPQLKLEGEVIFAPVFLNRTGKSTDVFMGGGASLKLKTSFTGKDELEIKLESVQIPELEQVTGTRMANLGFDGDDGGKIALDELAYTFPLRDRTEVAIYTEGGSLGDYVPTVSPWISDSEEGSISTFAKENPIIRQGSGAGIAICHDFSDKINFSAGYVSGRANEPERGLYRKRVES